jgi:putative transposase
LGWQNTTSDRSSDESSRTESDAVVARDSLDHVVVLNETHLRRLLREYLIYYHGARTHLSLAKDTPEPRRVERLDEGRIVETPMAGGLHHRYGRRAA